MIVYHGGMSSFKLDTLNIDDKISTLISFANNKTIRWQKWWDKLFIDSGAYSVWKSGKKIDIKSYMHFINKEQNNKRIVCASLDVIGNAEESYKNYMWLIKKTKCVIVPVIHFGEPISILDNYIDKTNYICIGASVGRSSLERRMYLDKIFNKFPDPQKIGFHGLGVTAFDLLKRYPWISVDSTSAMNNGALGNLLTPYGSFCLQTNSNSGNKHINNVYGTNVINEIKKWVNSYGIDWDKMLNKDRYGYTAKTYLSAKTIDLIANKNTKKKFTTKVRTLFEE